MPKIGFYVAGVATGPGAIGMLLAWDRHDQGPQAADDIGTDGAALYSWIGMTTGAQLIRAKSKSPISIPEAGCPSLPDGTPDRDLVARIEIKPGGSGMSAIVDLSMDIFDGSERVYGAAPDGKVLKAELAEGSFGISAVSVQDRLTLQPWEDPMEGWAKLINASTPSKELWRALMTPNARLDWF